MQWASAILASLLMVLAGCSSTGTLAGQSECPPPVGDFGAAPVSALECEARRGNKEAQLELAIHYQNGDGVGQDFARAYKLLRMAAADTSGVTYVYSPAVGKETYGRVIPIPTGAAAPGLAAAQYQLSLAYAKGEGVAQSAKRARVWLERAAAQKYAPALVEIARQQATP